MIGRRERPVPRTSPHPLRRRFPARARHRDDGGAHRPLLRAAAASRPQIGMVLSAALWGAALAALAHDARGQRFSRRALLVALSGLPVLGCALLLSTRRLPGDRRRGVRRHAERHGPRPRRVADPRAGDPARDRDRRRSGRASSPGTTCFRTRATRSAGSLAGAAGAARAARGLVDGARRRSGSRWSCLRRCSSRSGGRSTPACRRRGEHRAPRRALRDLSPESRRDPLAGSPRCSPSTAWPAASSTTALLAYFFSERFGVGEATVGLLFFGARVRRTRSRTSAPRGSRSASASSTRWSSRTSPRASSW